MEGRNAEIRKIDEDEDAAPLARGTGSSMDDFPSDVVSFRRAPKSSNSTDLRASLRTQMSTPALSSRGRMKDIKSKPQSKSTTSLMEDNNNGIRNSVLYFETGGPCSLGELPLGSRTFMMAKKFHRRTSDKGLTDTLRRNVRKLILSNRFASSRSNRSVGTSVGGGDDGNGSAGGVTGGEHPTEVTPIFLPKRKDQPPPVSEIGGGAFGTLEDGEKDGKLGDDVGEEENEPFTVMGAIVDMIFGKALNILLLVIPLAWWSHVAGWSPVAIFWLNFFAMVPLAALLGDFTEEVAAHTNQVIGGLINATFGNAVEVVVAIQALLANEIRVVQASMIGSIFSNLLLVLGGCFFFGGLKFKEQIFNSTAATANMSLLALSSIALVLPTPFAAYYDIEEEHVLSISRVAAIFLMSMYMQLLIFQLQTHAYLFADEEEEPTEVPLWFAISGLVFVTAMIAQLSDYLVGSIDGFTEESGVSRTFVGLIILPVVGNAVEHMTAISVAMKDKMDLAMGVAVGSCTQISLFVVPLTVLVGWVFNKDMTLNFPHFEITLFIMSVVTVSICLSNPKSNWLEGSLLMTTYIMIAVGFWFEVVKDF